MEFIRKIKQFFIKPKEVKLEPVFPYSYHVKETRINEKGIQEIIPEAVEHNLLYQAKSHYQFWNEMAKNELNETHVGTTFGPSDGDAFNLVSPKEIIKNEKFIKNLKNDPIKTLSDNNITHSDLHKMILKESNGKNKARKRRRVSQRNNTKSKKTTKKKRSRNKISSKKSRI